MILFYSHLLDNYGELLDAIDQLSVNRQEKREALLLVNKTIHSVVIDTILENTSECYHSRIIVRIQQLPEDRGIIDLVNNLTGLSIEDLLRRRLAALHLDLLEDLLS